MKKLQKTIERETTFSGIGVNTGEKVMMRFKPAPVNTGAVFIRTDLAGSPEIPAKIEYAGSRLLRTSIIRDDVEVQMIEHIMAVLSGLDIDNIHIEIDGPEVPCGDGSALGFCETLSEAGIVEQNQPRHILTITAPISVADDSASLVAIPSDEGLSVSYTLCYDIGCRGQRSSAGRAGPTSKHGLNVPPMLRAQYFDCIVTPETFAAEIAPARTFILESDIEELRTRGMGRGATYQNMLVIGEKGIIENEPRFSNEFARHKALDLIGDMYMLGAHLNAHLIATRSGHQLNKKLVEKIRRTCDQRRPGREELSFDIDEIQRLLPHRYPFLMIDRILELEYGKRVVGIKNVTINEPFFQGHWPGRPVMPGVLQIEAMAQMSGFLLLRRNAVANKLAYMFAVDNVKLRKPVRPGDQLLIEAEAIRVKSRIAHVRARASVGGETVAEAEFKFMLVDAM